MTQRECLCTAWALYACICGKIPPEPTPTQNHQLPLYNKAKLQEEQVKYFVGSNLVLQ